MKTPPGYEPVVTQDARAFARSVAREWITATLRSGRTLHEAAMQECEGEHLEGRGPVPVVSVDGRRWAVRHYYRGGAVASVLEDRYLRLGEPRPLAEARWTRVVRLRGVPTSDVVAGAVYPAGPFYRADLVTEYVPRSRDLAAIVFGEPDPEFPRDDALEIAGRLLVLTAEAGVFHPDVNAKNILVQREGDELAPMLLDLDRCRVDVAGIGRIEDAMVARLKRSLRKLGHATGRPLSEDDWVAFEFGVHDGGAFPGA